eukprot:TRINITY_DN1563_c0_g2_i1.p6 TRINITY_DN1563_c0_g2~~TRINITY_DN1563_c0_g2_i1.p6  ORF type:complete len:107 (+),score=14.60 TRINITY_DN1563_c0_g2_i1:551-871(+)
MFYLQHVLSLNREKTGKAGIIFIDDAHKLIEEASTRREIEDIEYLYGSFAEKQAADVFLAVSEQTPRVQLNHCKPYNLTLSTQSQSLYCSENEGSGARTLSLLLEE